jgi:hypothetical protein
MSHQHLLCKEVYYGLLSKTENYFKKIGISDAYIKEFIMTISICISHDVKIEYSFFELTKIANYVNEDINIKSIFGYVLQQCLKNKTPIDILNMLHIQKKITRNQQDFIIHKMKSIFNYDTICCKVEICDIKFIMNKKTLDVIKIMNDVDTHVLLNLFCKKHNLSENNVKFYIDNMEMKLNEKLIEYGISYENNIIDIIIFQKS